MEDGRILVFTGAGISAESGLATFRETGGIWTQYNPDEVCNIRVLRQAKDDSAQRKHIFSFYNLLKKHVDEAQPNAAHFELARIQNKLGREKVIIYTANVDDLFEKAGAHVIHVHGDLKNMNCMACSNVWPIEQQFNHEDRCPKCNSRLTKPSVIFFGEQAPNYEYLLRDFHLKRRKKNDHIIVVGTSLSVVSSDMLNINKKIINSGTSILINKDETPDDYLFSHALQGKASIILPQLLMNI